MSGEKWYALYTNPRAEKKVYSELNSNGFESYLPLQKTLRTWSDRKKWIETPLFNSYIFIKVNLEKSFYDVLKTHGVVKFVKFGKEIAAIRDSQIADIKLLLSNFDDIEILNDQLVESGQKVEVIAGPLKGQRGIVTERKGSKYFSIDIEQIGFRMLVSLPLHYLKNI